jgi:voltage-gated potassium channel
VGENDANEARSVGLRRRVYRALNPEARLGVTARLLIVLILLATAFAIAETEVEMTTGHEPLFRAAELFFAAVFGVEYAARLWSAPEGGTSRLRYALKPTSLLDLVAVVGALLPFIGADILVVRLLRIVRIVRLAKLGRYSRAFSTLARAVRSRGNQLLVAFTLAAFFLIVGSTAMYWIEGESQPDDFGSIPRAMWWCLATITTVGYGDAIPATAPGKMLGGLIAMGGIVLIAIPTGIMAAAFSDELHHGTGQG